MSKTSKKTVGPSPKKAAPAPICSLCGEAIRPKKDMVFITGNTPAHWSCAESENVVFSQKEESASFWQNWPQGASGSLFSPVARKKAGAAMKIGYARISTKEQSLDMQVAELKKAGCDQIYTDTASGSRLSRPGLDEMLRYLRSGDEVVVWKMDRLARKLLILIGLLERINDLGAAVTSLSEPTLGTSGPQGKLVLHVLAAVAEYEVALIKERSRTGYDLAKARGVRMGRPPSLKAITQRAIFEAVSSGQMSMSEAARVHNVSPPTVGRIMNRLQKETGS